MQIDAGDLFDIMSGNGNVEGGGHGTCIESSLASRIRILKLQLREAWDSFKCKGSLSSSCSDRFQILLNKYPGQREQLMGDKFGFLGQKRETT